jgi:hypothetical protein
MAAGVFALVAIATASTTARADDTASAPAGANIRSVLLFPIANNAGATASDVGPMIDDAVRLRLASVDKFKVSRFSRLLAAVQQGLADKELTEEDVQSPFADDDKDQPRAAKIAQRVGVDAYFVGNLDSYKADPVTKTVTLQVTGSLYFTESGVSAKSVGTSVTAKAEDPTDQLDTVVQSAVNDAAGQIAASINAIPLASMSTVVDTSQHGQKLGGGSLLLALLGGALIYAAFHHDSSSNGGSSSGTGGGSTGPPPPPGGGGTGTGGPGSPPSPPTGV